MKLHENFAPIDGVVGEFPLIDEASLHGVPYERTSLAFYTTHMEVRRLRATNVYPLTSFVQSEKHYCVTPATAVALAMQIMSAYSPDKLLSSRDFPKVTEARIIPSQLSRSEVGRFVGGYVNFVLGQQAPSVAFTSRDEAVKEATRLLSKVPLPGATFTAKIEHAAGSSIHIERHG